ncbi:MAG: glycosyltransferase [Casimicrobiaceae bacterium]
MTPRCVAFVTDPKDVTRWRDIGALTTADVDLQQSRFRSGIDVWIVQSYLLLREPLAARGYRVLFGARYPRNAIGIAHWDDLNAYFNGAHRARLIGVRADRSPLYCCERVIVQNDTLVRAACERYVPHWPQPGLVVRDATRAARIETLAYHGRLARLPRWLRESGFRRRLAALGVTLRLSESTWNDYHDVDLAIAMRAEGASMLELKPATKLTNAWLAGVPMLLDDEPAFRGMRRSPLDGAAVANADDVLAAVARLKRDPHTYAAMVANGHARAAPFTRAAVAQHWLSLIDEVMRERDSAPSLVHFVRSVSAQRRVARRFRARHIDEQARAAP